MSAVIETLGVQEKKVEEYCRDRRLLLKIKIKSLTNEARLIRREERKCPKHRVHLLDMMRQHRVSYLREIMRSTHIAYGLMRGLCYLDIEPKAYKEPNWSAVEKMLTTYQLDFDKDKRFKVMEEAKEAFKHQKE